jgi:hypothetical protein
MNKLRNSIIAAVAVPFVLCLIVVLGAVFVFVAIKMFAVSDNLGLP